MYPLFRQDPAKSNGISHIFREGVCPMSHYEPIMPAVPTALKHRNRKIVLDCFRDYQEHTVADIVARTGISKLTVMRAIQFFCAKNIIVSSGKGSSTDQGGKKPEFFRFGFRKNLLTVMMWPEMLELRLFDMQMREICRRSFDWIIPSTPEKAFSFVREQAAALMEQAHISRDDLYGVSLSTSGIVDYENLVLKISIHSPEWGTDIPVGTYLKEIFGPDVYCFIENAGKCISRSILKEQAQPQKRLLVLFTSWGLSGSLISGGEILGGRDSLIGEIGHMILDPSDTEQCTCGSYGCMEQMVSLSRLRKFISQNPPPADSPLAKLSPGSVSLTHLFFASRQNDPYAQQYVRYLADCFASLLRNVSLTFNPENVVITGDYAIADECFDSRIREQFHRFRYFSSSAPIGIHYDTRNLQELDARGGAFALLDHFFSDPHVYEDPEKQETD